MCERWPGEDSHHLSAGQAGAAAHLQALPLPLPGGAGLSGGGGSFTCICLLGPARACCPLLLCELSVGVLRGKFPSLCGIICLPGPISAYIQYTPRNGWALQAKSDTEVKPSSISGCGTSCRAEGNSGWLSALGMRPHTAKPV